ncbi:MAG: hypothetical protein L0220_31315 [Acidobacteria bacterium]|nr:hypothetical protein [Acidobacteriota bacterium]
MKSNYDAPADVGRIQALALGIAMLGLITWIVGAQVSGNFESTIWHSYLVAFVFWAGIALGCLGWLMLQYLGGATWGLVIRRPLEAGAHTLILLLFLFIPIAIFGLKFIYEWTDQALVAKSEVLTHKSAYLNVSFFIIRTAGYFAIWLLLMFVLRNRSHRQDETGDPRLVQSAQDWSGPGFLIYGLACTFAAIDWVMSIDPEWFSTIFGLIFIAGQGVSSMAFIIAVCMILSRREPMSHVYQPKHFHDLGKLMLALVMLWAYFSFSQLLIQWMGNLPEEIPWFLERFNGGWRYVGIAIILLHFTLPFLLLLSRNLKRNARRLVFVAWLIIFMRLVDLLWLIVPEFEHGHGTNLAGYIAYFSATICLGGIWVGWFFWQLSRRSLLPYNDPQLQEALAAGGGH